MTSRVFWVRGLVLGCVALTASCGGSNDTAVDGNATGGGGGDTGFSGSTGAGGASTSGGFTASGGFTSGGGSAAVGNGGFPLGGAAGTAGGGRGGRFGAGGAAGMNGGGMGGASANCPAAEPMNMAMCTMATPMGATGCTYPTGNVCTCRGRMGMLAWRCIPGMGGAAGAAGAGGAAGAAGAGGAGGNAMNCPMSTPTAGGMCTRATAMGQSNTCTYGTDVCTCQRPTATMTMSTWACVTCPTTAPMSGADCTEAGACNYTVMGRQTTCTCRTPIGAGGAPADGGAMMTWACR